jgi:hypothetical protein
MTTEDFNTSFGTLQDFFATYREEKNIKKMYMLLGEMRMLTSIAENVHRLPQFVIDHAIAWHAWFESQADEISGFKKPA